MALVPVIRRYVDELHGASAQDCPGADVCQKWRRAKKCKCPRGAPPPRTVDREFEQATCTRIEQIAIERRAGLLTATELDELDQGLLVCWTAREREHDRVHMAHVAEVADFMHAWVKSLGKGSE